MSMSGLGAAVAVAMAHLALVAGGVSDECERWGNDVCWILALCFLNVSMDCMSSSKGPGLREKTRYNGKEMRHF